MESDSRRFQKFRRIVFQVIFQQKEMIEGANTGQDPRLRFRMEAYVLQSCRERLQIFQSDFERRLLLDREVVHEFGQIRQISLDRMAGKRFLQLQILPVFR